MNMETPIPDQPPKLSLSEALLMQDEEKSELDKIIEMILDPANIAHNTELSRNEITAFSVLSTLYKRHPTAFPALGNFLKENLILRVSKSRKGRAELIKILNRQMQQQELDLQQTRARGFFGGRRR